MYQYGYSEAKLEALLVSYCKSRGFNDAIRAVRYAAENTPDRKE